MGQALYRKYRSKKLSEIIGQEHITDTLSNALKSGRISHAYLFTGPRGVGKTSIARIWAHEINGLPYDDDSMHLDIIEIDAASNRRIDEIRELRDKVATAPTSAKYKVYIIDEVHMLTKEAFNALLKTLEEPPAHVVFILATTDAHKLPDTIISRTQRFTFKPVETAKVVAHLRQIATDENLLVDDDALALLAAHGEGSFRDSISLLDQASNQEQQLTLSAVQILLGIPPEQGILALQTALQQSGPAVAQALNALYEQGYQATAVAKVFAKTLRSDLLADTASLGGSATLALLTELLEVPMAHDPERFLEIVLLGACSEVASATATAAKPAASTAVAPVQPVKPPEIQVAPATAPVAKTEPTPKPQPAPSANDAQSPVTKPAMPVAQPVKTGLEPAADQSKLAFDNDLWPHILGALKSKYNTLYGVVRMATPSFEDNKLELAFGFVFHQKRLNDPKNKTIVSNIIHELTGQSVQIDCIVRKDNPAAVPANVSTVAPGASADISAINDIFGGSELIK